jgi:hypothetical protein
MDISRLLIKEASIHKHFPKCITKPDCDCFVDFFKQLPISNENEVYIIQSIDILEHSLYMIKVHQNKEAIVEVIYMVKIPISSIRSAVHFMITTKKKIDKLLPKDKKCYIDFPNKPITVSKYLQYVELFCNYHLFIIDMMYFNTSKIPMEYLRNILEVHMELIFIFEQFLKLQKYGYSYTSETNFGSKNCIQLYWN